MTQSDRQLFSKISSETGMHLHILKEKVAGKHFSPTVFTSTVFTRPERDVEMRGSRVTTQEV